MKFLIFSIFFSLITINPLIAECKDESTSSITNSNQSNLKELKVPAIGLKHLIGVTYNWAALLYEFRGYKRWKLSNSDNILWKNNHIDIGVVNSATPFFNMMGVYLEVEPIAILNLKFDLQKVHFFHLPVNSAFGYLYYPKEENDPDKINFEAKFREKRDELPATSTDGYRFKTTAELKLMVKKVAVVSNITMSYLSIKKVKDEIYWYDGLSTALHKSEDFDINTLNFLFYKFKGKTKNSGKLLVGPALKYTWVYSTGYTNKRIGLASFWELGNSLLFMKKPTWLCSIMWYKNDKYHKDFIPYILTAFSFNTDY